MTGRNEPCPCGSGRKYKNCHLQPFYPQDYFDVEIKAFDLKNIIQSRLPESIQLLDAKVSARDPMPWDNELVQLLGSLNQINWNENDRWQKYAKGRVNKLRHKLDALKFHSAVFKNEETVSEQQIKNEATGTLYNYVIDRPVLIYVTESFLFQSKSCLDVLAQLIADTFKLTGVRTFHNYGEDLIEKISKNPLKNYPTQCENMKSFLSNSKPWVKYIVDMRVEVTHYSDLEGLSCFFQRKCEKSDKCVRVYYPSLTDGKRVSVFMDETWNNIKNLIMNYAGIISPMFT